MVLGWQGSLKRKNMRFLDSETCGFEGPMVLLQHAKDDETVKLWCPWKHPARQTLKLIEEICDEEICGFNLVFDWFKIVQMYTTLRLLDPSKSPSILEYALAEPEARDGPCLRPRAACDLMLHARKGKYQNTMNRADLRIRRLPVQLAYMLAAELENRIQLPDLYFARKKDKLARRWQVEEIKTTREFKNVVLKFAPSTALKHLCVDAGLLTEESVMSFGDIDGPIRDYKPIEYAFAPFALAVGSPSDWKGAWPSVIHKHIEHWTTNEAAISYAIKDVDPCTRGLYHHLGNPAPGDIDSELACQVAAAKWKGFAIDRAAIKVLKADALSKIGAVPTAPKKVMEYLCEVLYEEERLALEDEHGVPSTKKVILEALRELKDDDGGPHPVAERARDVLQSRVSKYLADFYGKLIIADRLHASTIIIGARSSRMAGGQEKEGKKFKKNKSINPQGISKKKKVRAAFPLAFTKEICRVQPDYGDQDEELDGGDAVSFEVCIAVAYYEDPQMLADVTGLGPDGKPVKIHAHIGTLAYPHLSYQEVRASSGSETMDYYTRAKSALFALIYFGNAHTLKGRLGIDIKDAEETEKRIMSRYKMMGSKRQRFEDDFVGLKQPMGQGSRIYWNDPKEYVESMLGFKRFFTSENAISKQIFELAQKPPKEWRDYKMQVQRRREEHGGPQSAYGAAQSALYGAAFGIQTANMRAAGNHVIQSTGAQLTKILQFLIWKLQPIGIGPWLVRLMNIHDELMIARKKGLGPRIQKIVEDFVLKYKSVVPLLDFEWDQCLINWAGVIEGLCSCGATCWHKPEVIPVCKECE